MIDLTYLKTTTGNDQSVIKELINLFVIQLPALKKDIVDSFETKNWKALKEAAHKAKNSFEIMGVKKQAEELKRIEILATENKENLEFKQLINNLIITCELVVKEIELLKL
jgi:HPt (histidine-containing phosphotransfer) domain-containing protein